MTRRLLALILAMVAVTACGSSAKPSASSTSAPSATSPASSGSGDCPFSGSTEPQTQPGGGSATKLTSGSSSRSGCIDQFTLAFDPSVAQTSASYPTSEPTLRITLANTTYSGPSDISTKSLEYVQSIGVTSEGPNLVVTLTLDQQRPFTMSTSNVPAQLQLSLG